jgi:hypothetical protein
MHKLHFVATVSCVFAFLHTEPAISQEQGAARNASIGYPSVAAALGAMRARKDVKASVQGGWTVVTEQDGLTLWSFTPEGHPAYPAVVKRQMVQKDGAWYVNMNALCETTKAACDKLIEDFKVLNERMRQSIEQSKKR